MENKTCVCGWLEKEHWRIETNGDKGHFTCSKFSEDLTEYLDGETEESLLK